jgi:putative transposase
MKRPAHPPDAHLYPNHLTWVTRWRVPHFKEVSLGMACLKAIETERRRMGLSVFAYSLMPDHFHVVVAPAPMQIGRVVQALKLASVNRLTVDGLAPSSLWQEGYFDVALREIEQVMTAIEYLHNNPAEEDLVRRRADYPLSSCGDWEGISEGPIKLDRSLLSKSL